MSTGQIIQLVLQGLVFAVWTYLMFRTVFLLRRRAEAETGAIFHGPRQFIRQAGIWLRSPQDRSERGTLLFLTFVLFVMIVSSAFLGAPPN